MSEMTFEEFHEAWCKALEADSDANEPRAAKRLFTHLVATGADVRAVLEGRETEPSDRSPEQRIMQALAEIVRLPICDAEEVIEREPVMIEVQRIKSACDELRKDLAQAKARIAELEAKAKASLRWTENGEAGDGQHVCSVCGTETDEPHTHAQCFEAGKQVAVQDYGVEVWLTREALGDDQSGRTFSSLLKEAVEQIDSYGGGPLVDCLRAKVQAVWNAEAALLHPTKLATPPDLTPLRELKKDMAVAIAEAERLMSRETHARYYTIMTARDVTQQWREKLTAAIDALEAGR